MRTPRSRGTFTGQETPPASSLGGKSELSLEEEVAVLLCVPDVFARKRRRAEKTELVVELSDWKRGHDWMAFRVKADRKPELLLCDGDHGVIRPVGKVQEIAVRPSTRRIANRQVADALRPA